MPAFVKITFKLEEMDNKQHNIYINHVVWC